jgi:hypothetical protein
MNRQYIKQKTNQSKSRISESCSHNCDNITEWKDNGKNGAKAQTLKSDILSNPVSSHRV